ncbi:hypothetical protein EWM64_g6435 [Hericium alpestre]|uniref:Uncharacterized protein n=1 Tax=Hericium alpestre TaxID=135208 RepID=A0A4Y9ZTK7_9AGAM|nr:hypothetical protein EWM64_g6435 [Hericium alpestre]
MHPTGYALVKTYLYEFMWISRAVQAKTLVHMLLLEGMEGMGSSGHFIRRLHIEMPVLERQRTWTSSHPGVLAATGDLHGPPVDPAEPCDRVRSAAAGVDELRRHAVPPADVTAAGDADNVTGVPGAVVVPTKLRRVVRRVIGPGGGDAGVAAGAAEPQGEPGQRDVRGAGIVGTASAAEHGQVMTS